MEDQTSLPSYEESLLVLQFVAGFFAGNKIAAWMTTFVEVNLQEYMCTGAGGK